MKQVVRKGLREILVDRVPDPVVTPHHVIVRPFFSLISSGTESAGIHREPLLKEVAQNPSHLRKVWDVAKAVGPIPTAREVRAKFGEYAVIGYSGAGIVVDAHPTVTDLSVGDRVAYGGEGTGHGQYVRVGRNLAARVPDSVPFDLASFTTLGAIAINAVRIAEVGLGDTVAVIGLGLVGQLVCQAVRCQGGRVIATDLQSERVDLAKRLGAESGITGGQSVADFVRAETAGHGVDCVIVAAKSKSPAPCIQALDIVRDRGRIIVVGAVELNFPWEAMYLKEVRLQMARAYGPGSYDPKYESEGHDYPLPYVRWTENRNMEEFLRLVADGQIRPAKLITHVFALEDAAKAYDSILDPSTSSLAVLLRYPEPEEEQPKRYRPQTSVPVTERTARRSRKDKLGVALVGAGNLARWAHLPNIKKMPNVELRGVCSSDGVRGKSYALRFGATHTYSELDALLDDPSVDIVVIVSRNEQHAAQALAALEAGKHVFLEKPMALTTDECREIYQKVRGTGLALGVGFNRRFAPFYLEQRQYVSQRNTPAVVNCRVSSPGISGSYWMADPSIGGAILGEACHFVDLMHWLLEAEPLWVSAGSLPLKDGEPVGQNNVVASIGFSDGSIGNLTYCTVGARKAAGERVEVFAPGVSAITEDFKRLSVHGHVEINRRRLFPDKGYRSLLEDFCLAVREGHEPAVTVLDGARSTIGCLSILKSARNLEPCPIDWQEALE